MIDRKELLRIVIIVIVVIIIATLLAIPIDNAINRACYHEYSYACKDEQLQLCIQDHKYTHDECVTLIGSK